MVRTALFWIHLASGVAAGLVILMMSATGVVLTYETQLLEGAERSYEVEARGSRRPVQELVHAAEEWGARTGLDAGPTTIQLRSDPAMPAQVRFGRAGTLYLDPYSAQPLGTGFPALEGFLGAVRGWHRWFDLDGDARGVGRAVTGASNLAFLVLLVTGAVLWIPRRRTWNHLKAVLLFRWGVRGRARDFNWHNVLGVWSLVPLVLIVASGVYISYPWAKDLVGWAAGGGEPAAVAPAPSATAAGAPLQAAETPPPAAPTPTAPAGPADLDAVVASAVEAEPRWRTLLVTLPEAEAREVDVRVNGGFRGESRKAVSLTLDAATGQVVTRSGHEDLSRDRRARTFLRFAHTGEYWGLVGQTLAGLVSLASVLLVWTGLSLALRRLARTLRRRADAGVPAGAAEASATTGASRGPAPEADPAPTLARRP